MARTYYNEFDPYAAQWLRNLSSAGHITSGVVDDRSIVEVRSEDVRGFERCHFFAGVGVWDYALSLAGVARDAEVWTGSCPCQPFSNAGRRRGTADERHLWPEWLRLIRECRPPVIFGEQVASADGRAWLAAVRADLEALGYAVGAADLCAAGVGAPHIRQRLYFGATRLADANETGRGVERSGGVLDGLRATQRNDADGRGAVRGLGNADDEGLEGLSRDVDALNEPGRLGARASGPAPSPGLWSKPDWVWCRDRGGVWRPVEPGTFPLAHGAPQRVGRLRAYGNAIVAQVAATFIQAFLGVG